MEGPLQLRGANSAERDFHIRGGEVGRGGGWGVHFQGGVDCKTPTCDIVLFFLSMCYVSTYDTSSLLILKSTQCKRILLT